MHSHIGTGGKSTITAVQIAAKFGFSLPPGRGYFHPAAATT